MIEDSITESRKSLSGILVGKADGFVGAVGAGQHQRVGDLCIVAGDGRQQQMMDGGVGQHHAEQRTARRNGVGHRRAAAPP